MTLTVLNRLQRPAHDRHLLLRHHPPENGRQRQAGIPRFLRDRKTAPPVAELLHVEGLQMNGGEVDPPSHDTSHGGPFLPSSFEYDIIIHVGTQAVPETLSDRSHDVPVTRRIYLDVCSLCRPFDDQTQMRIRLETDAVQLILSHVRAGNLTLVVSPAHMIEIGAIEDLTERAHLFSTLRQVGNPITFELKQTRKRAERLIQQGLGPADAAHLAFAEQADADFIICDDRLLRQCRRIRPGIWFGTPVAFCDKEDLQ